MVMMYSLSLSNKIGLICLVIAVFALVIFITSDRTNASVALSHKKTFNAILVEGILTIREFIFPFTLGLKIYPTCTIP